MREDVSSLTRAAVRPESPNSAGGREDSRHTVARICLPKARFNPDSVKVSRHHINISYIYCPHSGRPDIDNAVLML